MTVTQSNGEISPHFDCILNDLFEGKTRFEGVRVGVAVARCDAVGDVVEEADEVTFRDPTNEVISCNDGLPVISVNEGDEVTVVDAVFEAVGGHDELRGVVVAVGEGVGEIDGLSAENVVGFLARKMKELGDGECDRVAIERCESSYEGLLVLDVGGPHVEEANKLGDDVEVLVEKPDGEIVMVPVEEYEELGDDEAVLVPFGE